MGSNFSIESNTSKKKYKSFNRNNLKNINNINNNINLKKEEIKILNNSNDNNKLKNSNNNNNITNLSNSQEQTIYSNQLKNIRDPSKYGFYRWNHIKCFEGEVPSSRYAHTMIPVDTNIFIFGGYNGLYLNDIHYFDTDKNKWNLVQTNGTSPIKRAFHSSWYWSKGKKLYIYAGFNGKSILDDLYSLDIETMTWKQVITTGAKPTPRFEHTTSLIGDEVYLFGGANDTNWLNCIYVLNLETNQWRNITHQIQGDHPPKRCAHSTIVIGTSIFIFGGYDGKDRLNSLYEYDTINKKWIGISYQNRKKIGRAAHTSSVIDKSTMILFGGYDGANRLNDISTFNTIHREWRPAIITGQAPSVRSYHCSATINNKFYTFGGFGESTRLNELYYLESYFPSLSEICLLKILILNQFKDNSIKSINGGGLMGNNHNNNNENDNSIELLKKTHIVEQINNFPNNLKKVWWIDPQ